MKAAVVVADGVSARNFLLGDLGVHLNRSGGWAAVHDLPEGFVDEQVDPAARPGEERPLGRYDETPLAALLRYSLLYGQMHWSATEAMRHNLRRPVDGSLRHRALHRSARALGRLGAGRRRLAALDVAHSRVVARRPEVDRHRDQLAELAPDVLFCTHQRPPRVLPPTLAARQLHIPTATFVFSWDNLSSKGRIAAPFDHYLVWSDHMAAELHRNYTGIGPERIHELGTPQFDPYADGSAIWSRDELCGLLGVDPGRPLICYSGGVHATCP
jgi:hypothetical protein